MCEYVRICDEIDGCNWQQSVGVWQLQKWLVKVAPKSCGTL